MQILKKEISTFVLLSSIAGGIVSLATVSGGVYATIQYIAERIRAPIEATEAVDEYKFNVLKEQSLTRWINEDQINMYNFSYQIKQQHRDPTPIEQQQLNGMQQTISENIAMRDSIRSLLLKGETYALVK